MNKNTALQIDGFIRLRLLKVAEVAQLLNVSESHIYRLIKNGELPAVRIGRSLRIKPADLDEYISDKTQGGTQPTAGLEDQDDEQHHPYGGSNGTRNEPRLSVS